MFPVTLIGCFFTLRFVSHDTQYCSEGKEIWVIFIIFNPNRGVYFSELKVVIRFVYFLDQVERKFQILVAHSKFELLSYFTNLFKSDIFNKNVEYTLGAVIIAKGNIINF